MLSSYSLYRIRAHIAICAHICLCSLQHALQLLPLQHALQLAPLPHSSTYRYMRTYLFTRTRAAFPHMTSQLVPLQALLYLARSAHIPVRARAHPISLYAYIPIYPYTLYPYTPIHVLTRRSGRAPGWECRVHALLSTLHSYTHISLYIPIPLYMSWRAGAVGRRAGDAVYASSIHAQLSSRL
jgi:hypothetical protein